MDVTVPSPHRIGVPREAHREGRPGSLHDRRSLTSRGPPVRDSSNLVRARRPLAMGTVGIIPWSSLIWRTKHVHHRPSRGTACACSCPCCSCPRSETGRDGVDVASSTCGRGEKISVLKRWTLLTPGLGVFFILEPVYLSEVAVMVNSPMSSAWVVPLTLGSCGSGIIPPYRRAAYHRASWSGTSTARTPSIRELSDSMASSCVVTG